MRNLRRHILVVVGLALPLSLNAAYGGTHVRDNAFEDISRERYYGPESIADKIKGQKDYESILKCLEQTLRQEENVVCNFNVDKTGRVKNLRIISEKPPTALEKRVLALISKAAPFPHLPSEEMITKGGQIEFWQWHGIKMVARVAPAEKPPVLKPKDARDPFKDILKDASY